MPLRLGLRLDLEIRVSLAARLGEFGLDLARPSVTRAIGPLPRIGLRDWPAGAAAVSAATGQAAPAAAPPGRRRAVAAVAAQLFESESRAGEVQVAEYRDRDRHSGRPAAA